MDRRKGASKPKSKPKKVQEDFLENKLFELEASINAEKAQADQAGNQESGDEPSDAEIDNVATHETSTETTSELKQISQSAVHETSSETISNVKETSAQESSSENISNVKETSAQESSSETISNVKETSAQESSSETISNIIETSAHESSSENVLNDKETSQSAEDASTDDDTKYDPKNIRYEGELAVYTDPESGYQYEWDKQKNEWVPHSTATYGFEDDTHTYTDDEGMKFFWDKDKSAWFPKIDDDFMARYQLSYGFTDESTKPAAPKADPPQEPKPKPPPPEKGVKRKASEPTWFEMEDKETTKVYVSNLPLDITEEEFVEIMQKCGIVMRDTSNGKLKIKLYTESGSTALKGDGLCTYIRTESVELALNLLDGYDLRGKKIKVERAKFQMKGDYDPKLKPKSKKRKEKDKIRKMQQQLFDWRPEKQVGERAKHERVVIVKNVFESKMFDEDVGLILEFQQDLREECSKCGVVRKVIIYDRHPEGIAQINMKEPEEADACVVLLNGRWFGKRQLSAAIWDGKTKFKIAETDSQINQRIDKWEKFLESDEPEKKEAEGEL